MSTKDEKNELAQAIATALAAAMPAIVQAIRETTPTPIAGDETTKAVARDEVVRIMTSKTVDERVREQLDQIRGKNNPTAEEWLVPCQSPANGARFTARLCAKSHHRNGVVVELLDYAFPEGMKVSRASGGICPLNPELMLSGKPGQSGIENDEMSFAWKRWMWETFERADSREIMGKPASYLERWRTDRVTVPEESIVLTPAEAAGLGVDLEEVRRQREAKKRDAE